jgi:predicted ATPase
VLTRFKVNGFKNLVDVDVRFGPFTCIAGSNGVGKSNLFDAIRFLSTLSRVSLLEAAKEVRGGRTVDVRGLFHRVGDTYDEEMTFEAEMIVPKTAEDDLGQLAEASITFLRYSLTLAYRHSDNGLEIRREELVHINKGEAKKQLLFPHTNEWRDSAIRGKRTSPFISTKLNSAGELVIRLHQDRGESSAGVPSSLLAHRLPRTLLQAANAAEHRTAVIARREMESWKLLRLEPSVLREPDEFNAPSRLSENGAHLPATLNRLAQNDEEQVYAAAANRLSKLISDVREIGIDRDEKRELLTLWAKGEDDTPHAARSLSEGTLRFLALAVLELDPESEGVLCLEEPENGIHPERIPAMIQLLKDIAVDPNLPVGKDNPLRQVIANTHSPAVVLQVNSDDLIAADLEEKVRDGKRFKSVVFRTLPGTWRATGIDKRDLMPRMRLMSYLHPVQDSAAGIEELESLYVSDSTNGKKNRQRRQRVIDRTDVRQLLLFPGNEK